MTPIQIITVETNSLSKRIMIEKIGSQFICWVSIKRASDQYYDAFEAIMENETPKLFSKPSEVLHFIVLQTEDKVIKANNEISDLISTDDIKKILDVDSITIS